MRGQSTIVSVNSNSFCKQNFFFISRQLTATTNKKKKLSTKSNGTWFCQLPCTTFCLTLSIWSLLCFCHVLTLIAKCIQFLQLERWCKCHCIFYGVDISLEFLRLQSLIEWWHYCFCSNSVGKFMHWKCPIICSIHSPLITSQMFQKIQHHA